MVPSAYLRAYVPADSLSEDEVGTVRASRGDPVEEAAWRQLSEGPLGVMVPWHPTPGWRLDRPSGMLVCPARVRLRSLVGMLALREQYPQGIAEHLVSDELAGAAAHELEALRFSGRLRTHVLQSTWQVPLRWFIPFDDSERRWNADQRTLTYETLVATGLERTRRAAAAGEEAGLADELVEFVTDLADWLADFTEDGALLQLDYGGLTSVIPVGELADDHSAEEIWQAVHALEAGDLATAGEKYYTLNERWAQVRALESAN